MPTFQSGLRTPCHDALIVNADVGPTDVVTHDEDDIDPVAFAAFSVSQDQANPTC